ncbi:MAG: HEAT repeat domain-containing protein [Nitrospirae bacterium]|nr:HEAT repeat domain-containing protein [Nitrospirota bacterium]
MTYDKHSIISWRAIEAVGLITGRLSMTNPEIVRNLIGRLLWMIRDESGGIGWSSPEMLGEIVRNSPGLFPDIAPVIVSFHDEKMLTAGVLRAIGRIGKINSEFAEYANPIAGKYLCDPDPVIRGYAAWALGETGTSESVNALKKLQNDGSVITIYAESELKKITVGRIAKEAIEKITIRN